MKQRVADQHRAIAEALQDLRITIFVLIAAAPEADQEARTAGEKSPNHTDRGVAAEWHAADARAE